MSRQCPNPGFHLLHTWAPAHPPGTMIAQHICYGVSAIIPPGFEEWMQDHVHRVAAAMAAVEDATLVPVLAAHPWFLHWLARQPEWTRYAEAVRGESSPT